MTAQELTLAQELTIARLAFFFSAWVIVVGLAGVLLALTVQWIVRQRRGKRRRA